MCKKYAIKYSQILSRIPTRVQVVTDSFFLLLCDNAGPLSPSEDQSLWHLQAHEKIFPDQGIRRKIFLIFLQFPQRMSSSNAPHSDVSKELPRVEVREFVRRVKVRLMSTLWTPSRFVTEQLIQEVQEPLKLQPWHTFRHFTEHRATSRGKKIVLHVLKCPLLAAIETPQTQQSRNTLSQALTSALILSWPQKLKQDLPQVHVMPLADGNQRKWAILTLWCPLILIDHHETLKEKLLRLLVHLPDQFWLYVIQIEANAIPTSFWFTFPWESKQKKIAFLK